MSKRSCKVKVYQLNDAQRALADIPLTENERQVLDRHLAGEKRGSIARTLGVTGSYVGQALNSARRKIRDWLDDECCETQKEEPRMKENPEFPALVVFVIYDPETDLYMTTRGGRCTYWAKDVRRAKRYQNRRCALNAAKDIEREGHGKVKVRMLNE